MSARRSGHLFEGYGGLSIAADTFFGAEPAWHSEIEPAAIKLLEHHHPGRPNLGDITTIDWDGVEPVWLLTGGFPCFPAGTLVDAGDDGLRPIETLRVGDRVLTHARRRRRVTSVMRRDADDVLLVKAMGAPAFRATTEHPFYVRRRQAGHTRAWSQASWVAAGELAPGDMLAMPLDDASAQTRIGAELAYVIGRWLGDGWIVDHRRTSSIPAGQRGSRITSRVHKAIVCAAKAEADDLAARLAAAGLHATRADERTVVKFHISSMELVKTLRDFGRGAAGKRLPGWVFTASQDERAALLQGWLDADGSRQRSGAWRATTVSEELAYGMARLARNVHNAATSVHRFDVPDTAVIEGRTVRQRPQFQVVIPPRNREAFVEDGYAWVPVRSVTEAEPCEVFNVSVEDDESYTAWGFAVHNCQDVSAAGKRAGMRPGTRSGLWEHMARAVYKLAPTVVLIENVRGLLSAEADSDLESCAWCLGDERDRPLRALGAVLGDLAVLGYDARWGVVRASDAGAPHARARVFILAWRAAADPADLGHERPGGARDGWTGPADSGVGATADPHGGGDAQVSTSTDEFDGQRPPIGRRPVQSARARRGDVAAGGRAADEPAGRCGPAARDSSDRGGAAADSNGVEPERRRVGGVVESSAGPQPREGLQRERAGDAARDGGADARGWGGYELAVRRWERTLGRPAPAPTQVGARGGQQLSPRFVEWMMGLPEGWVTDVPGIGRNQQLKLLGNGVVPQQAELALHMLANAPAEAVAA